MKKQPIADFRKQVKKIKEYFDSSFANVTLFDPEYLNYTHGVDIQEGSWFGGLDITDDLTFRSIWIHSRFTEKSFYSEKLALLNLNEHSGKWNHCLFQTTTRQPLTDEGVEHMKGQIDRILQAVKELRLESQIPPPN